ncbi:MAG: 1,4-alpha-glucan branching protein domain-containing protein, partial [Candidatus Heimdallarchaeota archaeon]
KVGYPGDEYYQEFHKKDYESGFHYWRITGKEVGKEEKKLYDIEKAFERVESHANHFVNLIEAELSDFSKSHDLNGIIVSPFDFELYGHWWGEGIQWLKRIFELAIRNKKIEVTSISEYISSNRDKFSTIKMKESSWGMGGHFEVWKNPEHGWIWPYINGSIKEFESVLKSNPNPNEWELRVLRQISRELLLMEGSDWPFLLYTEQAKDYANQRFHHHHQRFNKMMWAAKNFNDHSRISLQELEDFESIDSCFSEINIDYFRKK